MFRSALDTNSLSGRCPARDGRHESLKLASLWFLPARMSRGLVKPMKSKPRRLPRPLVWLLAVCSLAATSPAPGRAEDCVLDPARTTALARSVETGLEVIQRGARNYPQHRKCFACHHQTLPLLGLTAARAAGLKPDEDLAAEILRFTDASFRGKLEELRSGEGIGGRGLTVGYGLWTFELGDQKPDELTEAMVEYLLKLQEPDGQWELHAVRPPAEESLVMCTVQAAVAIMNFAADSQRERADSAIEKARTWLAKGPREFHEDRVARLWGLVRLGGAGMDEVTAARNELLETRRPDGGWSQLPETDSDAYATGTALYVLLATRSSTQDEQGQLVNSACQRAADFLLKSQLPDGSWHVATRATPVQVYFDNGDPHGKDQFLSMAATSWCTAALAAMLPEAKSR